MQTLKWIVIVLVALAIVTVLAGQLGLLKGSRPNDLGVQNGRLKAPSRSPNSVSSQAALWPDNPRHTEAAIAPLPLHGDGPATIVRIAALLKTLPGAVLVEQRPDYLYAQFTTRLMKYVDDVEFWFDPAAGVVQVRSASRLGESDLGANRARIEDLRSRLAAGG